ncbi:transposase [Mesorhizobium sp. M1227]|uniref:transposase DNA-binding-containing protein n=1 Tax=Mesorhizobium sp. M1227 TaxID=2957071 RepID=UPI00333AF464
MSAAPGKPIPAACGDWAAARASYRFFDNPRAWLADILARIAAQPVQGDRRTSPLEVAPRGPRRRGRLICTSMKSAASARSGRRCLHRLRHRAVAGTHRNSLRSATRP